MFKVTKPIPTNANKSNVFKIKFNIVVFLKNIFQSSNSSLQPPNFRINISVQIIPAIFVHDSIRGTVYMSLISAIFQFLLHFPIIFRSIIYIHVCSFLNGSANVIV